MKVTLHEWLQQAIEDGKEVGVEIRADYSPGWGTSFLSADIKVDGKYQHVSKEQAIEAIALIEKFS